MDTIVLNTRKKQILDAQETMLRNSVETKVKLDEASFDGMTAELDVINANLARISAVEKGKAEVGAPRERAAITDSAQAVKFYAAGGYKKATALNIDENYTRGFWQSLRSKSEFDRYMISNASLGEGGTSSAGGALVPISTDPSIPALAMEETVARSLSRVTTTTMDIKLPYQASLTTAALKAESNSAGTNAFATNAPGFATTTLSAFVVGDSVYASWELLQDSQAAADFISFDIQRAIVAKEESLFVTGSGNGQPQGYLGNAAVATGADITSGSATLGIDPILDLVSSLKAKYYGNAKFLANRAEFHRLLKKQLAADVFQTFVTFDPSGAARLLGYNVAFSSEMPVYAASSPVVSGSWLFGDFASFARIGDRGDSNIRIKVLDQVEALNGQTVILAYRRTDQRVVLQEAVQQLNTIG